MCDKRFHSIHFPIHEIDDNFKALASDCENKCLWIFFPDPAETSAFLYIILEEQWFKLSY